MKHMLALGILIPVLCCGTAQRRSMAERLRQKNRYLKRDNRKQCCLRLSCAQVKNWYF